MLDGYIIDAIKREERERSRDEEGRRIRLEIPIIRGPARDERRSGPEPDDGDGDGGRGVVIIPLDPTLPLREDDAA